MNAKQIIETVNYITDKSENVESIFNQLISQTEKKFLSVGCELMFRNSVETVANYYYLIDKRLYLTSKKAKIQKLYIANFLKIFKKTSFILKDKNLLSKQIILQCSENVKKTIEVYNRVPTLMSITVYGPNYHDDRNHYLQIEIIPGIEMAQHAVINNTENKISRVDAAHLICEDILTNIDLITKSLRLTEI